VCPNVAYSSKSGFASRVRSTFQQERKGNRNSFSLSANDIDSEQHPTPDENVCRLLSCDFQSGHMCLYSSSRVASSMSMFQAFNQTASTMLFDRSRVAMLESTTFHLNAPARLHFDFSIKVGVRKQHI
jgi:hypothetical protein